MTTTSSTDDELRRQLHRLIVEWRNELGYIAPDEQSPMADDIMALIRQDREAREAAMEPTLQDVIDAGQFPTPEEYKKMIWMLRWCQNRITPPDSKAKA